MARRAEEEENHWPGFVDALSTIVMVVTFLLIILVVVIVVISQQVNPETDQNEAAQSDTQVAELEQKIAEITEVVAEQTQTIDAQEKTIQEMSQQAAQAESTPSVVADAGDTENIQAQTPIVETEIVVPRVDQSSVVRDLRSEIETAQAVMTVLFEENTVELDEGSREKALQFLEENSVIATGQKVVAMSYFDADSISVSQAKRTAYYRLLSVRNALLESGVEPENISASVQESTVNHDGTTNVNRVKVFLR